MTSPPDTPPAPPVVVGVPFGDTWEISPVNDGFTIETIDGETLVGYVLVPATPLENGKFLPGSQYWLRLDAMSPLPNAFRVVARTNPVPQSALDRDDWEQQPNAFFDGTGTVGYQPVTLGQGDAFYNVEVTLNSQTKRAATLLRAATTPPRHAWHGDPDGLTEDANDPDTLLIATETSIRFTTGPQPQSGTQLHPTQ